ncbi:MAG: hypothetical protein IPG93_24735 [Burkholderiales bacterium]|nr:hypothetical protein [Burkholderiales bacterium]
MRKLATTTYPGPPQGKVLAQITSVSHTQCVLTVHGSSMKVESDSALAKVLGVSKAQVSKHKKLGMPTGDVEAARAWRNQNLNPARRKDVNTYARQGSGYRSGMVDPRASIERVHALMELADAAIGSPTFETLRGPLQKAMRDVPEAHRAAVRIAPRVFDVLLSDLLKVIAGDAAGPAAAPVAGPAVAPMADEEADAMGAFLYSMACKEPFPADRLGI